MSIRQIIADLGVKFDQSGVKQALSGVASVKSSMGGLAKTADGAAGGIAGGFGKIAGLVAGAFAVGTVVNFGREMVKLGDDLGDLSTRTGITTDEIQKLQYASERAGGSAEGIIKGYELLNKQLGSGKPSEASKRLAQLGVATKNADGSMRPMIDLLPDISDAISTLPNQAAQTGAAVDIFSKAGLDMLPVLKMGGKGVNELFARFEELGGGLDGDFVKAAGETDDAMKDLDVTTRSLKASIGSQLLPIVNKVLQMFMKWTAGIRNLAKNTNILKASMIAFGIVAVGVGAATSAAWLPFVGATALAVVAVGALALAVDDLMTFFGGGKSLIGTILGPDSQAKLIAMKDKAVEVFGAVKAQFDALLTPERIKFFFTALAVVGSAMGAVFNTVLDVIKALTPLVVPLIGLVFDLAVLFAGRLAESIQWVAEKLSFLAGKLAPIAKFLGAEVSQVSTGIEANTNTTGALANVPASTFGAGSSGPVRQPTSLVINGAPVAINIDGTKDPKAVAQEVYTIQTKTAARERAAAMEQLVPKAKGA